MATDNGNGTVTVVKGDSLWGIAKQYLYDGTRYPEIAKLNNINSSDYIYPGQILKISQTSSAKATTTPAATTNAPVITNMGIVHGTDREIFATWTWDKHDTTEKYNYEYYYDPGDGSWFYGGGGDSGKRQHVTFTPNDKAKKIKFKVQPIAEAVENTSS